MSANVANEVNDEILASLRLLVAVAKADGKIHPDEELAIASSLEGAELPKGMTVASLLASEIDVDLEMTKIKTREVQRRTLQVASAMVYMDREASSSEKKILDKMREAFDLEAVDTFTPSWLDEESADEAGTAHIDDPDLRSKRVDDDIAATALWSAVWGAIPLPLFGEVVIMVSEVRLLQNIARRYGHKTDEAFWKAFAANLVGVGVSRFAVQSLMKLVPGWGSIAGASGSYATTWALGKAAKLYFEKGEKVDPKALKEAFKGLREEGLSQAKESRQQIEAERKRIEQATADLDADLKSGKISESAYTEKLAALRTAP
jgi:uncharacterized protein (DUF697 family)